MKKCLHRWLELAGFVVALSLCVGCGEDAATSNAPTAPQGDAEAPPDTESTDTESTESDDTETVSTEEDSGSTPSTDGENPEWTGFVVESNPHAGQPALGLFSKYVSVFGLSVLAEPGVSDAQAIYVATVVAELLDNDENGEVDDPALLARLQQNEALFPVFSGEGSAAEMDLMENYQGQGISAVLYKGEVDPSQPGHWGSDATVEEVMHTINACGHVQIYPEAFALQPGSSLLTEAMDIARGGQFLSVPGSYPSEAWYHYDDTTCDYRCMAIEYLYWAQVTNMGILDDPQTCAGIANEWEPCSPALLQSTDVKVYALITDPAYRLPQVAPNGVYAP
jgi:hypothetical protein